MTSRAALVTWVAKHPGISVGASIAVVLIVIIGTVTDPGNTSNTSNNRSNMELGAATSTTSTAETPPATAEGDADTSATGDAAVVAGSIPEDTQKARVRRIIDGDTLELAAMAAGSVLSSTQPFDVRLLEIDTPETEHPNEPERCLGAEATSRLEELAPVGSTVWMQRDEELRDKYDRYLLYLWNEQGTFVNLSLVADGFAQAELYEPNDRHWSMISVAESDARSANHGLWDACASFDAPVDTPEPTTQPEPKSDTGGYVAPPAPPDVNCGDVGANSFKVRPGDPHGLDSNDDGIGCE